MSFWSVFGESAWAAHTPFVVLAFFSIRALASRVPKLERYHLRAAATLLISVAEVLATRRIALSTARGERESDRRKRTETAKHDLLGRIRGFFGLDAR